MRPSPGLVLDGRYQLIECVAGGGMATIWRATDGTLGRAVAVKFLNPAMLDTSDFVSRFRSEARHAAGLSHPGIATVFDYVESPQGPYLTMEFVDGEPLSALLARMPRPAVATTMGILAEIAEALAVAHAGGVIHRDIKPSNVMITPSGRVKVTDFGIARALDAVSTTLTGHVIGTPQYMSPEQITGGTLGPETDVYSLGVVGYEMVSGARPFTADSAIALGLAHVHDSPPPLPGSVPADLRALIEECLHKDPASRPTAIEFADRVRAVDAPPNARVTPTLAIVASDRTITKPSDTDSSGRVGTVADPGSTLPSPSFSAHATEIMPTRMIAEPPLAQVLRADARRRRRRVGAATVVGVSIVAGLTALGRSDPDESRTAASAGVTAPAGTAVASDQAAEAEQVTTGAPPTTAPATAPPAVTVTLDEGRYLGRRSDEVVAELTALGFEVTTSTVKSDAARDTVLAVEPSGQLAAGSSVVVRVADKKGRKD